MDKAQLKETIVKAVKVAQEKGYTLVSGAYLDTIDGNNCACALGCVLIANDRKMYDYFPQLKELLGVEYDWVNAFIHAFDNNSTSVPFPEEAKVLAEELVKELKPIRHREWEYQQMKKMEAKQNAPKEEIKVEVKEETKEEVKEETK
jgi:hypothetical protein